MSSASRRPPAAIGRRRSPSASRCRPAPRSCRSTPAGDRLVRARPTAADAAAASCRRPAQRRAARHRRVSAGSATELGATRTQGPYELSAATTRPAPIAAIIEAADAAPCSAGPSAPMAPTRWTQKVEQRLREIFESPTCCAFPVATGTAANVLALAAAAPPWGAIFCHAAVAHRRRRGQRAGVLHRRRQALPARGAGRQDRPPRRSPSRWPSRRRRACTIRSRPRSVDHPGHRMRHRLYAATRSPRSPPRAPPRAQAAHGRRALRQRAVASSAARRPR